LNSEVQIVEFKQYIFDISQFGPRSEINDFKPRERYISELINPNPEDDKLYRRNPGVFRAELHNRLSNPLYPLAFVMIVIMFVGQPRTIRESRWRALVLTFGTSVGLRLSGFAATNLTAQHSSTAILVYALPLGAILVAGLMAYVRMSPRGRLQWRLGFPRKLKFPNNNLWALMALPIERRRGRVG
jgi:lipopolysaccharide export system permease protein